MKREMVGEMSVLRPRCIDSALRPANISPTARTRPVQKKNVQNREHELCATDTGPSAMNVR